MKEMQTYVIEGILLVHDGVQENPHGPNVLLFASIGFALQDFGSCIIYLELAASYPSES
jgi:hypothetical protein